MHEFVIYRDILPAVIRNTHGRWECGDVPIVRYNEVAKTFEKVDNPRGNAYAYRNDARYRLHAYKVKREEPA